MPNDEQRPTAKDMSALHLPYPAKQSDMRPAPDSDLSNYQAAGKLRGKVALITGGDSGIGRAVAIAFAMEDANVAIVYNENDGDADTTPDLVASCGQRCVVIKADVRDSDACRSAVTQIVGQLGGLNVLVNNAAYQMAQQRFEDISEAQFRRTLETNIFGYFYMAQAPLALRATPLPIAARLALGAGIAAVAALVVAQRRRS